MKTSKRQTVLVLLLVILVVVGGGRYLMLKSQMRPLQEEAMQGVKEYEDLLAKMFQDHGIKEGDYRVAINISVRPEFYVFGGPVATQRTVVSFKNRSGKNVRLAETRHGWYNEGEWSGVRKGTLEYKPLEDQLQEALAKNSS